MELSEWIPLDFGEPDWDHVSEGSPSTVVTCAQKFWKGQNVIRDVQVQSWSSRACFTTIPSFTASHELNTSWSAVACKDSWNQDWTPLPKPLWPFHSQIQLFPASPPEALSESLHLIVHLPAHLLFTCSLKSLHLIQDVSTIDLQRTVSLKSNFLHTGSFCSFQAQLQKISAGIDFYAESPWEPVLSLTLTLMFQYLEAAEVKKLWWSVF